MPAAFTIVMDSRRELVEKLIQNMEKGYILTEKEWDRDAFAPYNPLSDVHYKGGNRIRLIGKVIEKGYRDPRWMTARQLNEKGYYIKKGEHPTLCEKWIFDREKIVTKEDGTKEKIWESLEMPAVRYFNVFNGEQVQDFPEYIHQKMEVSDMLQAGLDCLASSECRITECAQPDAFYSPGMDRIFLPLREMFKDQESFIKTGLHEMVHSTGHVTRLNRDMGGCFGSESYAKEELRAELGAMFLEADLGLQIKGEHFQDHSNYLKSWIQVLQEDYNELFRACSDAEKAAERIYKNYLRVKTIEKERKREEEPLKRYQKMSR